MEAPEAPLSDRNLLGMVSSDRDAKLPGGCAAPPPRHHVLGRQGVQEEARPGGLGGHPGGGGAGGRGHLGGGPGGWNRD